MLPVAPEWPMLATKKSAALILVESLEPTARRAAAATTNR